jgi:hypothetical protein
LKWRKRRDIEAKRAYCVFELKMRVGRFYAKNEGGEKSAKKSGKILIFLKILL